MINKTGQEFNKEEAFDLLIEFKAAAATEGHKEMDHFQAVYNVRKHKIAAPQEQFKKYLAALIGDKEQEKVLDIMAKVRDQPELSSSVLAKYISLHQMVGCGAGEVLVAAA